MAEKRIGIALIGAGIVAEMHGRGVLANPDAKLVGVFDPITAKARAIAKKFGGRVFPSLEDAGQVAARFYGAEAMRYLEATGRPELPFHILGVKAPRDLCWLTVRK